MSAADETGAEARADGAVSSNEDAVAVVQAYLAASEARRLNEAQGFLAPGAELVFPGARYRSLEAMVAAAAGRYRWVKKRPEAWDVAPRPDGTVVVVSTGTLHGENLFGVPFEGVRYIDRFELKEGKILRQQVWNDLDASGVLQQRSR